MSSKTPQFDALLDEQLRVLEPHIRVCVDCGADFQIQKEDIEFLKMLRVPAPTHCPQCRNRRRLSVINYSNIYKRKCDYPGHSEIMISPVAPVMPWITYDYEKYYSDVWDPMDYGKEIDESKHPLEQIHDILKEIPQPGVRRGADSPNCDYSFYGKHMKDCYYVFGGRRSEDIMYGSSIYDSKHVVDAYFIRNIDIAYQHISTSDCYKCFFAYFSSNCIESEFIFDCRNCQNCFGCVNLRNKSYCWFNEQLTKEEYQKRRAQVELNKRSVYEKHIADFWALVKANPIEATRVVQSENVVGNDIKRSKNCYEAFQTEDSENIRYTNFAIMHMKNSMDANHGGHGDYFYETQNAASSSNIKFSFAVKESTDCEYVMTCNNSHNCFGCVGIKNVSYAIFNKKYEPEEYWKKLDEIKTRMLQDGTYGEFLPMFFSPSSYNASMAQVLFPMTEEEAHKRGLFWQPDIDVDTSGVETVSAAEIPDDVLSVSEEITKIAFIGERSGKPFRLTQREIEFYKRYKLPLPNETPYQRMLDRFAIMNNFRISRDVCFSCKKNIWTSYKTTDGYKPYCTECYQKEVV